MSEASPTQHHRACVGLHACGCVRSDPRARQEAVVDAKAHGQDEGDPLQGHGERCGKGTRITCSPTALARPLAARHARCDLCPATSWAARARADSTGGPEGPASAGANGSASSGTTATAAAAAAASGHHHLSRSTGHSKGEGSCSSSASPADGGALPSHRSAGAPGQLTPAQQQQEEKRQRNLQLLDRAVAAQSSAAAAAGEGGTARSVLDEHGLVESQALSRAQGKARAPPRRAVTMMNEIR